LTYDFRRAQKGHQWFYKSVALLKQSEIQAKLNLNSFRKNIHVPLQVPLLFFKSFHTNTTTPPPAQPVCKGMVAVQNSAKTFRDFIFLRSGSSLLTGNFMLLAYKHPVAAYVFGP
jgi:hypothetical protein